MKVTEVNVDKSLTMTWSLVRDMTRGPNGAIDLALDSLHLFTRHSKPTNVEEVFSKYYEGTGEVDLVIAHGDKSVGRFRV